MERRLCGLFLVLGVAGCASTGPGPQSVPVISDPSGATAIAGNQRITTPGELVVPGGAIQMEIRIEREGYETAVVILTPDSDHFRDCFTNAVSANPDKPPPVGPVVEGDSAAVIGIAIGSRLLAIAAGCSSGTTRLQPSLVLVKLVPLPEIPEPRRSPAAPE